MRILRPNKQQLEAIVGALYVADFHRLYRFIEDFRSNTIPLGTNQTQGSLFGNKPAINLNSIRHAEFKRFFTTLFSRDQFIVEFYSRITEDPIAKELYHALIWEQKVIDTKSVYDRFGLTLLEVSSKMYESKKTNLDSPFEFIVRESYHDYTRKTDFLYLEPHIRGLLRLVFELPNDYELQITDTLKPCDFSYSNEAGVFDFIGTIEGLLANNLVEFGATNEKPLAKTLTILKNAVGVNEFYPDEKKLNTLVTDMLTRSFYFYYVSAKKFRSDPLTTLQEYVTLQLQDKIPFFISRIFTSHLKKVRFDNYYTSQSELFDIVSLIINDFPKEEGWVSIDAIIRYARYRELRFDFESPYKTSEYYMRCQNLHHTMIDECSGHEYYQMIVFEPIIKGVFFYLASLGLVEIAYNKPVSPYPIHAEGEPYISIWDQLLSVRLSKLGSYCLGRIKHYEVKKTAPKQTTLKFDHYKPIITIDKNDTVMLARLEAYTEKHDEDRYILSYGKIFRDCKSKKALEIKIKDFYTIIGTEPPQVCKDFFDEILKNANMLFIVPSQIVIDLSNNQKLLALFMSNKRLQELVIKAQGYKIIVAKADLAKFTKIIKENGFFIEF